MAIPTATLKCLKNEDSGIDISVERYIEEEAPLGGVSVLYEISVLTNLSAFKLQLHKSEDVVQFKLYKAFREIEDFHSKLAKTFVDTSFPSMPKSNCTLDEKKEAIDVFMRALAKHKEACRSQVFTQFIGANPQDLHKDLAAKERTSDKTGAINATKSGVDVENNETSLFPKVKNYPSDRPKTEPGSVEEVKVFSGSQSKLRKEIKPSKSLFDDFDDEDLFSSKTAKTKKEKPKPKEDEKTVPEVKKDTLKERKEDQTDAEPILTDRKLGEVSMFKEQDLGDFITKDEESLFMVTKSSSKKRNLLLSSKNDVSSSDVSTSENLDDLLNIPDALAEGVLASSQKTEAKEIPASSKSEPQTGSGEQGVKLPQKPAVKPRPPVPEKPKPGLKPKPKPPTKPKPGSETKSESSGKTEDLKELDILKYIEQEQKALTSNLSLFD